MVYNGPSRGCLVCRTRRVKCDMGKPSCGNCLKRNTAGPGMRQLDFYDEAIVVFRRMQKTKRAAMLTSSDRCKTTMDTDKISNRTEPEPASAYVGSRDRERRPPSRDLSPAANSLAYTVPEPYCNASTRELLHHSATVYWPGFDPATSGEVLPNAWLANTFACNQSMLFHSMTWAAALHRSILRGSSINDSSTLRHQRQAILHLSEMVSEGDANIPDAGIVGMLALCVSEKNALVPLSDNKGSFDPPFRDLMWLNVYSRTPSLEKHWLAMQAVVDSRGGLDGSSMSGFDYQVQITDIIQSTLRLGKPCYPLCKQYQLLAQTESTTESESPVIQELKGLGVSDESLEVFMSLRAYTHRVHRYCTDLSVTQDLFRLGFQRNITQHQLLSLLPDSRYRAPRASEDRRIEPQHLRNLDATASLRCTMIVYALGVTFPIFNKTPIANAARKLKSCFEADLYLEYHDIAVWALLVGALGSIHSDTDKGLKRWFVQKLASNEIDRWVRRLSTSHCRPWPVIEALLIERYLWLSSACSAGGRQIWLEVERAVDDRHVVADVMFHV